MPCPSISFVSWEDLLCVAYFGTLLLQAEDFSNPDGLLDHVLFQRILWFTRLSLFQPGMTLACLYVLLGLACVGAWGIVLGYRVRLCAGCALCHCCLDLPLEFFGDLC